MIGTLLAAATLAAATPPDASEAFARRQYLLDADVRCGLLTVRERAALQGAASQARGALLRADLETGAIARRAADRARRVSCADPALAQDAAAARAAFTQWAGQQRQDFAGEQQDWHASRGGAVDMLAWTLWQDLGSGYRLGVAEDADTRALVLAIPVASRQAGRPVTLALDYRDAGKWPDYIEPTLGGLFTAPGEGVLAGRVAPAPLSRRIWTAGVVDGQPQPVEPEAAYIYWTFPASALDDMAALDPRDVARLTVELPGDGAQTLYVEIGDLAAAMAFLAAGDTPSSRGEQS